MEVHIEVYSLLFVVLYEVLNSGNLVACTLVQRQQQKQFMLVKEIRLILSGYGCKLLRTFKYHPSTPSTPLCSCIIFFVILPHCHAKVARDDKFLYPASPSKQLP